MTFAKPIGGKTAIALLVCTAVLLMITLGHGWVRLGYTGDGGAGPLGVQHCSGWSGPCENRLWGELDGLGRLPALAVLTLITGIGVVITAATCGVLTLMRRLTLGPIVLTGVAIACHIAIAVMWLFELFTTTKLGHVTLDGAQLFWMLAMATAATLVVRLFVVLARMRPAFRS
jgi:hypothetical protein